jgi:hypothetical protein
MMESLNLSFLQGNDIDFRARVSQSLDGLGQLRLLKPVHRDHGHSEMGNLLCHNFFLSAP